VTEASSRELLSRYVDGDLDKAEVAALHEHLSSDPGLATELEDMLRLRQAVSDIANGLNPPPQLDQIMEPLRRGISDSRSRSRTWVRGLAAAAVVVLGITVVVEIFRHRDGSAIHTLRQATPTDSTGPAEIFRLRPLPTSAVPYDEVRLGAADRLVESPIPEPRLDDPRPLEIVGPLTEDPINDDGRARGTEPSTAVVSGSRGMLAIASTDQRAPISIPSIDEVIAGIYPLRITVEGGRIHAVQANTTNREILERLRAAVAELSLGDLADGEYKAELTVIAR
jgi:hypothetical protein